MENILLMSLSNNLENNIKNVKENKKKKGYSWGDKIFKLEEYEYFTKVYLEELKPNKIIVFGTNKSSWNYLYNQLKEYFYSETEKTIFSEDKKEDIEYIKNMFENKFSYKCKIFFMESKNDFDNQNIIFDLISQIEEIKSILDEQSRSKIYIDITGGLRTMTLSILSIINVLKMYYNQLNIKVMYSKNDTNLDYFKIVDITEVLNKLDYVDAISSFTKYGSIDKLRDITDKKLLDIIDELYIRLQFNLKKIDDTYKKITEINLVDENEKLLKEKLKELKSLKNEKYHDKVKNYGLEIVNKYENNSTQDKELKNKRDKIVHPLNKKGNEIIRNEEENETLPNKKILIWNLGTGESGKGYEKIIYKYLNKENQEDIIETQYTFEPYIDNYDEIYIFGVETSNWESVKEYFANEYPDLQARKIKYEIIDDFSNINVLYMELKNIIEHNKKELIKIDVDITHSFREVPFNLLITLRLFELLNDNIVLNSVYYGEKNNDDTGSIYQIPILEVINLYKSIVEFKDYTKYTSNLEQNQMIDRKILEIMKKVSEAYTYNEYRKLIKLNKEFQEISNEKLDIINKEVYKILEDKLIRDDTYKELIKFIKKQKESKNYALTLFFLIDMCKYRIFKIDSKEKNEIFYKKIEQLKNKKIDNRIEELISLINKLNETRNDAGHINNYERVDIIYKSNLLNNIIGIMNKLEEEDLKKYEEEYKKIKQ